MTHILQLLTSRLKPLLGKYFTTTIAPRLVALRLALFGAMLAVSFPAAAAPKNPLKRWLCLGYSYLDGETIGLIAFFAIVGIVASIMFGKIESKAIVGLLIVLGCASFIIGYPAFATWAGFGFSC